MATSSETSAADNYLALSERKQQFKLVRRYGYVGLAVLLLLMLLVTYLQYDRSETGEFYIPLPQLMFVMLLGALLLNLTSVAFGALEIYAASGGETRYLIARHGYSTGLVTAGFAAFFLAVIALLGPMIDQQIDYDNSVQLGVNSFQNTVTAPFNVTSDYTGSSYLSWVEIQTTNNVPFSVTVYQHEDYSPSCITSGSCPMVLNATHITYFKLNFVDHALETVPAANHTADALQDWSRVAPYAEDQRYMIVLERKEVNPTSISYHQDRQLDPGFVGTVFTLLVLLIVLNAAAAVYNRIVRQKWRAYGEKNL